MNGFRADAKAEDDLVVIGGWEVLDEDKPTPASRWFSIILTPTTALWAFCKGKPFKTSAALEMFASLVSLLAFVTSIPKEAGCTFSLTGITDNLGNQGALRKFMST